MLYKRGWERDSRSRSFFCRFPACLDTHFMLSLLKGREASRQEARARLGLVHTPFATCLQIILSGAARKRTALDYEHICRRRLTATVV